jgi:hypothetical protein
MSTLTSLNIGQPNTPAPPTFSDGKVQANARPVCSGRSCGERVGVFGSIQFGDQFFCGVKCLDADMREAYFKWARKRHAGALEQADQAARAKRNARITSLKTALVALRTSPAERKLYEERCLPIPQIEDMLCEFLAQLDPSAPELGNWKPSRRDRVVTN